MQYGIITHPKSFNYGDDIQSLAAFRLLDQVDHLLDRESLNTFQSPEKVKVLCNGWFMENPGNWPPSDSIDPLFLSFHVTHNNLASKQMLDKKHRAYYKKHEPIGCRDHHTVKLFQSIGIEAYYSGCVTLTLENRTKPNEKTEEIIVVDAFNKNQDKALRDKMSRNLFPASIQDQLVYIEHSHTGQEKNIKTRLEFAADLLDRYARAHLVVTSRIHVALPCVAMGTPVLFLDVGFNLASSRNRFHGVVDYFNTFTNRDFPFAGIDPLSLLVRKLKLYKQYYPSKEVKFDWENPPENPVDTAKIKESIKTKVREFMKA